MKCQKCKINQATIIYSENINGKKVRYQLCEECAKELDINNIVKEGLDSDTLFKTFFKQNISKVQSKEVIKRCPCCGSTFEDFVRIGKLGCSQCYEEFQDKLDIVFNKMHGSNRYNGKKKGEKNSKAIEEDSNKDKNLLKLEENLKQMIETENYEEAAKIRDEIKKIKEEK
ncbi:MAG: UvrB/UvrC motif-containing protein [Clostridia bacterium]